MPILITGTREASPYSSDLKLTRSMKIPFTFTTAVSKCFDLSLFDFITPYPFPSFLSPVISAFFFYLARTISANYSPNISSKAMSMSWLSFPISLSRTQPPATRRIVVFEFSLSSKAYSKKLKISYSYFVN